MAEQTPEKFFCISYQRTGTTSVGKFFRDHAHSVATYQVNRRNGWTESWFRGDYEAIFDSEDFATHSVFEDDPWWCMDFYKVLFQRFPTSKFILFTRDADRWFDSMVRHSAGRTLGNTYVHSRLYRREADFAALPEDQKATSMYTPKLDSLLPLDETHRAHYVDVYNARNDDIGAFFERFGPDRLFRGTLEDEDKWLKLGQFAGIDVNADYDSHEHKAKS